MIEPLSRTVTVLAGETLPVELGKDERFTRTSVKAKVGEAGVLSFRGKAVNGQYEIPESPNTLDLAERKSISFSPVALEEIEIANAGASPVTLVITQLEA